jgi:hypothetical protein
MVRAFAIYLGGVLYCPSEIRSWISICTYLFSISVTGGAGIAQSVQRLTTGWATEESEFQHRYGQEFSLLHVVHAGSGVQLVPR